MSSGIIERRQRHLSDVAVAMIVLVISLVVMLVNTPSASGQEPSAQVEAGGNQMNEMSQEEVENFLRINSSNLEPNSGFQYDPDSATGWIVNGSDVYIAYDLVGSEDVYLGTIGTLYQENGEETTVEIVAQGSETQGNMRIWNDHEKVMDQDFDESAGEGVMVAQSGNFFTRFNDCMNNEGIPGWVTTGIGIGCSAVCVATLGTGCVICVAAAAGVFSTQASYCFDQAA